MSRITPIIAIIFISISIANATIIHVPDDFETIQGAIDEAEDGDTVLVHPGEYVENIDFSGKNIAVIGDPEDPSEVVIDGNEDGSVVTFANGETRDALLSGFTVRNGTGTRQHDISGGGVFIVEDSSPTLLNLIIKENNTVLGGGIFIYNSSPYISKTVVENNETSYGGGGIDIGGPRSFPEIVQVIVRNNNNISNRHTGGILCEFGSRPILRNILIDGNSGGHAGLELSQTVCSLNNLTIVNNLGREHAGGILILSNCNISLNNTIIWNNIANGGPQAIVVSDYFESSLEITYCDIRGSIIDPRGSITWGEGNINSDPLFVDPDEGDYHLQPDSPCIDTGDPDSPRDPDGTRADMGAFYSHHRPLPTMTLLRGWNLTSININPIPEFYDPDDDRGPDVIRMFDQLRIDDNQHRIFLVKNQAGRFYAPHVDEDGFNNIPYWNLAEGYWIRVTEDCEATWEGDPIPADEDIWLDSGWNMIAYFPTYDLPISSPDFYGIESILDNVILMKDSRGRFARPDVPFSNMLPLTPGQGYQIRVDEDVVLNYPPEEEPPLSPPLLRSGGEDPPLIPPYFAVGEEPPLSPPLLRRGGEDRTLIPPNPPYTRGEKQSAPPLRSRGGIKGGVLPVPVNTGQNMSVLVTSVSGVEVKAGDQIAAFNFEGMLVGVGQFNHAGMCGLAVWGDDPSTEKKDGLSEGERFTLKFWNASEKTEADLNVTEEHSEQLRYNVDEFLAVTAEPAAFIPTEYHLSQAYPNPFNSATRLSYGMEQAGLVKIQVFDVAGRHVTTLVNTEKSPGNHIVTWDAINVSSGVYIVRMSSDTYRADRKVVLMR